jgi:L,D-transpeptidase-like protein
MRTHVLLATLVAGSLEVTSAQAAVTITINKSIQQMTVAVDGRALYHWPVSTGRPGGYDTPSGRFKAFRMERHHFSKEWDDAPMPFSIFFTTKGHAIHGSYSKRIGAPASHGCVRLSPANAEKLYALVQKEGVLKTTVILAGVTPSGSPAVARRKAPRPDDLDAGAQPQYGRQQYSQPAYSQPQYYGQQPYGQPQQYGQPLPRPGYEVPRPVYAQPQYGQQWQQPQYPQPPQYGQPPRNDYGRDPYQDPYQNRPRTLFPFN